MFCKARQGTKKRRRRGKMAVLKKCFFVSRRDELKACLGGAAAQRKSVR